MLSPAEVSDLAGRVAALQQWALDRGLRLHGVDARAYPHCGAGVVALRDIAPGQVLVEVPEDLVVCTALVRRSPHLRDCLAARPLAPIPTLCLFLLVEDSLGDESTWHPWIQVLPQTLPTLLHLVPDALPALRNGIRIGKVLLEQDRAKSAYHDLRQAMESYLEGNSNPVLQALLATLSWERFLWAYSCLMSRGFYFAADPAAGDVWAMVPWADFFNYSPSGDPIQTAVDRGVFRCKASSHVQRDDQVFLKYGSYSNFELLLWYGFRLPDCARYPLSPLQGPGGERDDPTAAWILTLLDGVRRTARDHPAEGTGNALQYADEWPARVDRLVDRGWDADWWVGTHALSARLATSLRIFTVASPKGVMLARRPTLASLGPEALALLRLLCRHELTRFRDDADAFGSLTPGEDPHVVEMASALAAEEREILQNAVDASLKDLRSYAVVGD